MARPRSFYFQAIRVYSALELGVLTALMIVALGDLGEGAEQALGWTHGIGWIVLCVLVAIGCARRVFPWPLLAATVSPVGPLGSTVGIELLARREPRAGRVA